ncbi:pectin lyase 2 [Diaporthe sp. PMI_573]|nr:pectin lyase 2 [Diaporthaceae sp. PMI_573]
MLSPTVILAALAAFANTVAAAGVTGAAEGFAKGVTGGGSAAAVYPKTNDELVSYLTDSSARTIILTKTFDFTGTEGTQTTSGCAPYGTASACQLAINKDDWCKNYQASSTVIGSLTYDKAAWNAIKVQSNKSLVGQGSAGVIKGKGVYMANGVKNIIIQNVHFTEINPQYVWGGDAISIAGADMIWIDHVKTSRIGRQHLVLGNAASNRVTISNSEFDGSTNWSATCDNHHYFLIYFTGSNDMITFKGNYVHHSSGRSPKVAGNTLLHAVNNYFYANSKHAFETTAGAYVLLEGNTFQNVVDIIDPSAKSGKMFTSPDANSNAACKAALGRNCVLNAYGSSGTYTSADTSFLSNFKGKNIAAASAASANVAKTAGVGKI